MKIFHLGDNFVAYDQAIIQNAGRSGISLTAGFRWAIGKAPKKIEKVQKPSNEQKVFNKKILKHVQNDTMGKSQTVMLADKKILKQNSYNKTVETKNQKVSKINDFFAKMDGESKLNSSIINSKAIISKI